MSTPLPKSRPALHRFLASVGIGAASLEIHTSGTQHPRGSTVEGKVILRGGEVTQQLTNLTLQLRSFAQGDPSVSKTLANKVLARSLSLASQEVQQLPFAMLIPDNALLSRVVGGAEQGCVLAAWASLEEAWFPRQARIALNTTVHREIEAVLSALREMGFVGESWFSRHLLRPNENEETTEVFRAPKHLQEQLETLSIFLKVSNKQLQGKVLLELRSNRLSGHVKGLVGGNKQQHPVQIPREILLTANGQPNSDGAIPYLKQILSLALALPDDPQSWMLRPSMPPPTDPDTLLRPTMPTSSVSSDYLLRPTAPPEETP